jgi:hypothetical protein
VEALMPLSPVYTSWGSMFPAGLEAIVPSPRSLSKFPAPGMRGLANGGQIAASTVSTAGGILTGTAPLWTTATWAIPVIGAVVVTLAIVAIFSRKGPKQKVATTEIVNKVEPLLKQNLDGYMAGPHTVSSQKQALANFDAGWAYVVEYCDTPEMGNPGKACVNDRQSGGKWDWFSYYRNPIANDTAVVADPVVDEVGNLIDSVTGGLFTSAGGSSGMTWLLLAGLALVGVFVIGGGK